MTRIELINLFLLKARAWCAQEEQAADIRDKRSRYTRLSVFEIHTMTHLAQRGQGATVTAAQTHIERRQFMRSAETAKKELNDLAERGYLEKVGNAYRLAPKGIEFVNSTIA
jgi:hypothetical protein